MDSPVSFCGINAEKAIKETTRVAKKKVIMTVSRWKAKMGFLNIPANK